MSYLFDTNLNILKKYHADVCEKLYVEERSCLSAGVESVEGKKVLFVKKEEKIFLLDSMYDFQSLLSMWQSAVDGVYNSTYLFFGFGNGMFVRSILQNGGPDIRLFVYEPSSVIFLKVLQEFDLRDILSDSRVTILLKGMETDEKGLFLHLADRLNYSDIDGLRTMDYINYDTLFPEEYSYFYQCRDDIQNSMVANRLVLKRFGPLFLKNAYHNAPYFAKSKNLSSLYSYIPEGLPAVIVAAGPSLNHCLDTLKTLKGKALIICVDSAVNVLLKNDIIPDLYVCMDPKKNAGHFKDERIKDIPVCCVMSTSINALNEHRGACFFSVDENQHVASFLSEEEVFIPYLSTGGSVANDAMSIAELIGIKNIILIGQDLAYTNNQTHAQGSLRADWKIDIEKSKCMLEGIGGGEVVSSNEFKIYRDWFEREIKRRPELNVINATGAGARIHGAVEMDFAQAAKLYCDKVYPIGEILQMPEDLLSAKLQQKFMSYMNALPTEFENLKNKIRTGIRGYQSMKQMVLERSYQNNRFMKLNQEVQGISTEVDESPYMYYPQCLMQTEIGELLSNAYEIYDDEREELKESINRGINYLEILNQGIEKAITYLEEVNVDPLQDGGSGHCAEVDDISFVFGKLLCAATDRNSFIALLVQLEDIIQMGSEYTNEAAALQAKRLLYAKDSMAIQRYAVAIALSALTGDTAYYEDIRKTKLGELDMEDEIADKLNRFSEKHYENMLQCLADYRVYFETVIAPVQ